MNGEIYGVPTFTPFKVIFTLKPKFYEWYSYYLSLPFSEKMNFKEKVPWGIVFPESSPAGNEFPNMALHPAMFYELILNLIGFLFIWFFLKNKKSADGTIACSYIIIYSIIRIFVSFFRAEDLMFFDIRAPHLISIILITISLVTIKIINRK